MEFNLHDIGILPGFLDEDIQELRKTTDVSDQILCWMQAIRLLRAIKAAAENIYRDGAGTLETR